MSVLAVVERCVDEEERCLALPSSQVRVWNSRLYRNGAEEENVPIVDPFFKWFTVIINMPAYTWVITTVWYADSCVSVVDVRKG